MARKRKDAQAVKEILMLEAVFTLALCRRCQGRPGPEHVGRHAKWLNEVQALERMFTLPARRKRA